MVGVHDLNPIVRQRPWKNSLLVSSRSRRIWGLMKRIEQKEGLKTLDGRVSTTEKFEPQLNDVLDEIFSHPQLDKNILNSFVADKKINLDVQSKQLLHELLSKEIKDLKSFVPITTAEIKKIFSLPWEDWLSTSVLAALISKRFQFIKGTALETASEMVIKGSEYGFLGLNIYNLFKNKDLIKDDQGQLEDLKEALRTVKGAEWKKVKAEANKIKEQMNQLKKSEQGLLSNEFWQKSIKYLLLQIQLYPKKYQQERAILKVEAEILEKKITRVSHDTNIADRIFAVNLLVMGSKIFEPLIFPGSIVSLALKTFSINKSISNFKKSVSELQEGRQRREVAVKELDLLKKEYDEKASPEIRQLIQTSEKIHRVYHGHHAVSQSRNIILKTLGFLQSATGITSLAIKILGVITGVALAGASSILGLIALSLALATLIIRSVIYIYRNQYYTRLSLQQAALSIKIAASHLFQSDDLAYLQKLRHKVRVKMSKLEQAQTTTSIKDKLLVQFSRDLKQASQVPGFDVTLANRIIKVCTGEEGVFLAEQNAKTRPIDERGKPIKATHLRSLNTNPLELQQRTVASLYQKIIL